MEEQQKLFKDKQPETEPIQSIEKYEFDEPIKGYPELRWQGKRPFRSTQYYPAQLKEIHGEPVDGWLNRIYWGDNLQVMSHLLKEFRGKVQLVYIDPPFDSKADYKKKISLHGQQATNDHTAFEEKQYTDIWNNDEYLQFMYERLILLRELLSEEGTIYLHCDYHKVHHLRCILDEIFGSDNFVNEITWYYYNKMAPDSKCFPRASDKILSYAKSIGNQIFHKQVEKRDTPVKQLVRKFVGGKAINARDEDGKVMYRITDTKRVDDVWRLSMLQPADKIEPLGYPTQKPEALLERIVKASSNPDDLILDCFMGSGTTQAVAMKLGRRFIGADINLGAVQITTKRLLNIANEIKSKNTQPTIFNDESDDTPMYYTGFSVYNVNNYDVFRNPVEAKDLLMQALEIQQLPHNKIYDGEKDGRMVKIMPINRIATKADLNELISNLDYKTFEKRKAEHPNQPVERISLICMGHEPDLGAALSQESGYKLDVEVVDIYRDKAHLEFKRDSEAKVVIRDKNLVIENFYPMNLLQKFSMFKENVQNWKELAESIMIDWDYDGQVLKPAIIDIPEKNKTVTGTYPLPDKTGAIRVKITDLLSESWEGEVYNG
ncbi:MAG: site-specific DNA-methyltransferase [Desulfamplus sp.]|nr:site-specific DNA-methyltransferase [Desulfamplus sp.]